MKSVFIFNMEAVMKDYTGAVPVTPESFNEYNEIAMFMGPFASRCVKISAEGLKALVEKGSGPAIIDVRPPEDYRKGHICGAAGVPIGSIEERFQEVALTTPVVVYGQTPSGADGAVAADKLHTLSFGDVRVLDGGIQAWKEANGCIELEARQTIG